MGDSAWRHQLNSHDSVVDDLLLRYGGTRVKHTGDGVFALFDAPTKAARCALELVPALAARNIAIRAGIHTGECERRGAEWSGMAVHIGARIGALAGAGEVLTRNATCLPVPAWLSKVLAHISSRASRNRSRSVA
jgi:class 3 adenylate cyclase